MEGDKEAILLALCHSTFTSKTIIFTKMKTTAHRLKIVFGLFNMKAGELHGNLTQSTRLQALEVREKSRRQAMSRKKPVN